MKYYSFCDALSWMEGGGLVGLTLNGVERLYHKIDNRIICIPNSKEHLSYVVKDFKIDAVLSNDWVLYD